MAAAVHTAPRASRSGKLNHNAGRGYRQMTVEQMRAATDYEKFRECKS